jgi:site-specific recombinase XerD
MPKGDRPAEPLSAAEVRALLKACGGSTRTAIRDHALLVLMWRVGLRCSEALDLRPSDVNFAAKSVRVMYGKGRKPRTCGVDDAALAALGVWLDERSAAGVVDGPLFCRLRGEPGAPLSTRYVRAMIARLAARAGVVHRVSPHSLRHTMAVESVREGIPVPRISKQLGHSSIATTAIYLDHLHPAEVVDAYSARSWAS